MHAAPPPATAAIRPGAESAELDSSPNPHSCCRPVARFRSLIAALLLALWLPATLHCALEQAGLLPEAPTCSDHCATDNCDQFENGLFAKSASVVLKAPAMLTPLGPPAPVPATVMVPRILPARMTCPPGLAENWQFVFRAAPWPGAPSPAL